MDRIDIKVVMNTPKLISKDLFYKEKENIDSYKMKIRVFDAIAFMDNLTKQNKLYCFTKIARKTLDNIMLNNKKSLRYIRKLVSVAQSIACLEQSTEIKQEHILESASCTNMPS